MARKKRPSVSERQLRVQFMDFNSGFFGARLNPGIKVSYGNIANKFEAIGLWKPKTREIIIDKSLMFAGESAIYVVLLHEMVHADLDYEYVGYAENKGHGTIFQGEICRLWRAGAYDGLL
jgi:hypothetical protein